MRTTLVVFLVASLLASCVGASPRNPRTDEDLLPGWMGSDRRAQEVDPSTIADRQIKMEVLDWDARIFMFHNFLSPEECDHIIEVSEKRLSRSGVVDTSSGGSTLSTIRTSFGVFLDRGEDEVVRAIEDRIAKWTLLPVGNGEGLQVLRYNKEQKYDAHWDYFFHKDGISNGGNRYATVLTYLADTEEGGETVFPNIPAPGGVNEGFSDCAKYHLAAKPKKGTAILFHSIKPSGDLERKSLHTACPVIRGVKWSMAKWIHVGHYAMGGERAEGIEQHPQEVPKHSLPQGCEDLDELCYEWAQAGECERNPNFMVGTRARPGHCIKSCNRCDITQSTGAETLQYDATKEPTSRRRSTMQAPRF